MQFGSGGPHDRTISFREKRGSDHANANSRELKTIPISRYLVGLHLRDQAFGVDLLRDGATGLETALRGEHYVTVVATQRTDDKDKQDGMLFDRNRLSLRMNRWIP
jgi:hypothetical protein